MTTAAPATRRAIYLRSGAIERLTAPLRAHNLHLNQQQQADLLGLPHVTYWRLINRRRKAGDLTIADVLAAAERIAKKWDAPPLRFDDLFEVVEDA